jgi:uncharacterized membrane protein YphA (DoxX/SURF4 family)
MKLTRIVYWTSTVAFALIFAMTGSLYLLHSARMVSKLYELGYPLYVLNVLGVAKVLGSIALVVPKFPRLKEWAYAGFVIDFVGAVWSHTAVQGLGRAAVVPLLPLALVLVSYVSYRRMQSDAGVAVAA